MTISKDLQTFLEKHIRFVKEKDGWDEFFRLAQEEFVPPAVGKLANIIESCGMRPLSDMTFIPEGYFWNSDISDYITPQNIINICFKSFAFSELEQVTITNNVREIDAEAFEGCDCLEKVTIQEGLKYIGDSVFYNCKNLTSVILPESLVSLGHNVFYGCDKLTEIVYKGSMRDWNNLRNSEFINEGSTYIQKIKCRGGTIHLLHVV